MFIRNLLFFLVGWGLSSLQLSASEAEESFEGRVEYEIINAGAKWSYTLWLKDTRWRTELKLGDTLYELRMGDLEDRSGYLVNDGGKNYRSLARRGPWSDSGPRGEGGPEGGGKSGGQKPSKGGDKKKPGKIDPEKFEKWVQTKDEVFAVDGFTSNLVVLKGSGKAFSLYPSEGIGMFSPYAVPNFKATQEKGPLLGQFFRTYSDIPLKIVESGNEKKSFSMVAKSILTEPIDDSLLTIPEDYKEDHSMMGGGRPGAGGGSGKRGGGGGRGGKGGGGGGGPPR
ncbi:hypothetical protein MLD52_10855 [Puniceicoccaceae bacterium K14]|nr:hypothetical protein [Puniceicoccaceae bacterium K14]